MKFLQNTKKVVVASLLMMTTAQAGEFKMLPILDSGFKPNLEMALSTGFMSFTGVEKSGVSIGVEGSLDCPIFTLPQDNLRQQFMINVFDSEGLKTVNLELNPYYLITLQKGLQWGFGPGFGIIMSDTGTSKDTALTFQVGTGLKYNIDKKLYVGADFRYQWTQDVILIAGKNSDLNNYRSQVKIGYKF